MNSAAPHLERLWGLCPDLLAAMLADRTITATNPAWTTALGWSEDELRGRDFLELVHPDDRPWSLAALETPAGPVPVRLRNRCRGRNGAYHDTAWTFIRDGDGLIAIGERDSPRPENSTSRRDHEIDAARRFAGVVGHDFNNLLQGIVGSMELVRKLIEMQRAGDADKFINAAISSARKAATLTGRLHNFSASKALGPKRVDVNALLSSIKQALDRATPPSTPIDLQLAADLWPTWCDAAAFEDAIVHLVANAREATPTAGEIVIKSENARIGPPANGEVDPGDYVCVSVTDTGAGMPPEAVERAFEPFFTTKKGGAGAGLGLASAYGFMRQQRGYATISSAVGKGTSVALYFPRSA